MSKLTSLSGPKSFQKLKLKGRATKPTSWMVVRWIRNNSDNVRLGCTFPRYIGTAVVRNRLRRWSKEYFRRECKGELAAGVDVNVILLRKEKDFYKNVGLAEFELALAKAWKRIREDLR